MRHLPPSLQGDPSFSWPHPPAWFAGRHELLLRLFQALDQPGPAIVALSGAPGSGRSTLLGAFGRWMGGEYRRLWFPASQGPKRVWQRLAAGLDPERPIAASPGVDGAPDHALRVALAAHADLVVVAGDPPDGPLERDLLPMADAEHRVLVAVGSPAPAWCGDDDVLRLELPPLQREAARKVLVRSAPGRRGEVEAGRWDPWLEALASRPGALRVFGLVLDETPEAIPSPEVEDWTRTDPRPEERLLARWFQACEDLPDLTEVRDPLLKLRELARLPDRFVGFDALWFEPESPPDSDAPSVPTWIGRAAMRVLTRAAGSGGG